MLESPSVDLVGVASRSPEKAESFRAQFDLRRAYGSYESMLEDPQIEAVYIPLPSSLHAEWMIRAAECGKHCLCEKPFTTNAREAAGVLEVFSRCGYFVMEAFMWRMHSQHRRARMLIERGRIGPVRLVRAAFTFHLPRRPDIRLAPELGGGSVLDIGCYPISAARFYFADEPASAFALGEVDPEHGVDMTMSGVLEFSRGEALIDCSFRLPQRTDLEIVGEQGTIRIPKPWLPEPEAVLTINDQAETMPYENQHVTQFEFFSTCILERTPPHFGPEDALRQMRVIDAVLRSMRSGAREKVG
jgi:predicted dehydrogenase